MFPRGLRRGQVNFRSDNSFLSLGASFPGRGRACVLFGVSFRGGYSPTGLPGDTAWLAFPPTERGWLGVLSQSPPPSKPLTTPPPSSTPVSTLPARGELTRTSPVTTPAVLSSCATLSAATAAARASAALRSAPGVIVLPGSPVPPVVEEGTALATSAPTTPTRTGKVCPEYPPAGAMSGRARRKNPFKAQYHSRKAAPPTAARPTTAPPTTAPPTAAAQTSAPPTAAPLTAAPRSAAPLTAAPPTAAPPTAAPASAPKPPSPSVYMSSSPMDAVVQPSQTDTPPLPSPTGAREPRPLEALDGGEPYTPTVSTRRSGYNTRSVSFCSSPTTGLPVAKEHPEISPMSAGESCPQGKGRKRAPSKRGAPAVAADGTPASKRLSRLSERLRRLGEDAADGEGG